MCTEVLNLLFESEMLTSKKVMLVLEKEDVKETEAEELRKETKVLRELMSYVQRRKMSSMYLSHSRGLRG